MRRAVTRLFDRWFGATVAAICAVTIAFAAIDTWGEKAGLREQVKNEGRRAAHAGVDPVSNPYRESLRYGPVWLDGYLSEQTCVGCRCHAEGDKP